MRRIISGHYQRIFMAAILTVLSTTPAITADLGVHGKVWPITEANLLDRIAAELGKAETDGRLAAFNGHVRGQVNTAFTSPSALPLHRAVRATSRLFDPSITVQRDIRDHKGTLIAARGTRVNPLEHLPMTTTLIFVDGRDQAQLGFAFDHPEPTKIILTGGNPKALMEAHKHRLFFDQKGVLTAKFRIKALPSIIRQDGNQLRIDEVVVDDAPTDAQTGETAP